MKLDQDDVARICTRVVNHDVSTKIVAAQFDVTRRRVQQLAKQYRDSGDVPQLDTPGRNPYADPPTTSPTACWPSTTAWVSAQSPSPTSCGSATTSASPLTPSTRFSKPTHRDRKSI